MPLSRLSSKRRRRSKVSRRRSKKSRRHLVGGARHRSPSRSQSRRSSWSTLGKAAAGAAAVGAIGLGTLAYQKKLKDQKTKDQEIRRRELEAAEATKNIEAAAKEKQRQEAVEAAAIEKQRQEAIEAAAKEKIKTAKKAKTPKLLDAINNNRPYQYVRDVKYLSDVINSITFFQSHIPDSNTTSFDDYLQKNGLEGFIDLVPTGSPYRTIFDTFQEQERNKWSSKSPLRDIFYTYEDKNKKDRWEKAWAKKLSDVRNELSELS